MFHQAPVVANYYAADADSALAAFVKVQRPHMKRKIRDMQVSSQDQVLQTKVPHSTMFRVNGRIVTDIKDIQVRCKCDWLNSGV